MQVIEREGKKYRVPGNLTRFQEEADEIFRHLKPDLSSIATAEFYRGFCLEFSGANSGQPTGPLGDQSAR